MAFVCLFVMFIAAKGGGSDPEPVQGEPGGVDSGGQHP